MPDLGLASLHRTWFRQVYDHLGQLILAGLVGTVLIVGSLAVAMAVFRLSENRVWPLAVAGALLSVSSGVVLAGWHAISLNLLKGGHLGHRDYLKEFRKQSGPGLVAGVFGGTCLAGFLLGALTLSAIPDEQSLVRTVLLTLWFWGAVSLGSIQVHWLPFWVHQQQGPLKALQRAFLVALWKPGRTLTILGWQVVCLVTILPMPVLALLLPPAGTMLASLSLLILLEEWQDPYEPTAEAQHERHRT